jgi:DNA-binding ferritin-like protein (Dps family)
MAAHVETFGANNNVYTELSTVSLDPRDKILMKGEDWSAWTGSDEVVGESVFSHKKNDKSILRVQDAFDAELALAKANLDEIIYRYTFVEIKDALLNDLYAYVGDAATGKSTGDLTVFTKGTSTFVTYPNNVYAADNKGIAPYFWQDTTTETAPQYVLDAMVDILKNYITGYNNNAAADKQTAYTANIIKDNGVVVDTVVTWLNEDAQTVLKTLNGYNLPSNIVTDEYKAYANIIDLTYTATDLVKAVEGEIDAAVMDLANEAVEYRFNDYIKDARDALLFAHMSYEVAAPTYEVAYKLKKAYNENLDQITSVEYLWNIGIMGKSDTMTHFNAFTGSLLGTVISYDSPYYGLLSEGATLKEQLKTVKSTTTLTNDLTTFKDGDAALAYASKWNPAQADFGKKGVAAQYPVSVTTSATGLLNKYNATGSAVVAFDKILNAGAKNFDGASLY